MERFSTLLTENYKLEQEMLELLSKFTNEPKSIIVECTPSTFKISLTTNFGGGIMRFTDIMGDIHKVANEYPFVDTFGVNEDKFDLTLKKVK